MKKNVVIASAIFLFVVVLWLLLPKGGNKLEVVETNKPASVGVLDTSGWEVYKDAKYGYSIKHPKGFFIEAEGEYSKRIMPTSEVTGVGPVNFVYISVVTPNMKNNSGEIYNYNPNHTSKLLALQSEGESVNISDGDVAELKDWYTYTLVSLESIGDAKVKNFENTRPWEFPGGTTENRFIYSTNDNMYLLGYYTGGDGVLEGARLDPKIAYAIIKSFTPSAPSAGR